MDVLDRSWVKKILNGLGALKGANCTIKSTKEEADGIHVVFGWTGTDGTSQTTEIIIPSAKNIYFTLDELSLTKPCHVGDVFNALPDKSIIMTNVDSILNSVTDCPEDYGLLTIQKYSASRFSISYKKSMSGEATDNKLWIGQLKGSDGSGLTWKELGSSTSEDTKEIDITTASTTWKLQHNLKTKTPSIECLDNNSVPIGGEIDYKNATINYIEVTFCKPVQGKAIIRK